MRGSKAKKLPFRNKMKEATYIGIKSPNTGGVTRRLNPECGRALYKRAKKELG